jgi:riboflavin kinase/FMN adenylyltransferase
MTFPAQIDGLDRAELPPRPLHLAIGMFDGVHLGHRAVVEAAVHSARASGGISAVLTFWPHPSTLFRPEQPTRLMQSPAMKARRLLALGVDAVITQAFTPDLAALPAQEFLPWLQRRLPRLVAVYVGENFRFGQGRSGDVALLVAQGGATGVHVFSAPRVSLDGEPISSTRIRELLEAGEIEAANARLGSPYTTEGVVTPGKRLGRTIGFPTLNVPWSPELRPRLGVYAVRVTGPRANGPLPGVANYGVRPTVENTSEPRLEVHVLGACPLGEGDTVAIEWLRFLRPERKFAGLEELRAQIAQDRVAAAAYFGV